MSLQIAKNSTAWRSAWVRDINGTQKTGLVASDFAITLRSKPSGAGAYGAASEAVTLTELDALSLPGQYEFRFTPLSSGSYVLEVYPTFTDNDGASWREAFDVVDLVDIAGALCTRDQVKLYLGGYDTNTKDDQLIDDLIDRATDMIERYCGRVLSYQSITDYPSGGGRALVLSAFPVTEASVQIWVSSDFPRVYTDATKLVNGTDYIVSESTGIVERASGVWPRDLRGVKATFSAGYQTTPPALNWAAVRLVSFWLRGRKYVGISGASGDDGSITRYDHDRLPLDVKDALLHFMGVRVA